MVPAPWCAGTAHVLSDRCCGAERLFLSERAVFGGKAAIRGGVPICFPQFSGLGKLPKRMASCATEAWVVGERGASGDAASVTLETCDDAASPHRVVARISPAPTRASGAGPARHDPRRHQHGRRAPFNFTGALHTYFAVDDIGRVAITGLAGREYRDAAGGNAIASKPRRFWDSHRGRPRLSRGRQTALSWRRHAPPARQRVRLSRRGGVESVGPALCAGLPDMAPDGYRRMVCIEAAAARRSRCPQATHGRGHKARDAAYFGLSTSSVEVPCASTCRRPTSPSLGGDDLPSRRDDSPSARTRPDFPGDRARKFVLVSTVV